MATEPSSRRRERLALVGALFAGAALWVGAPAFGGSDDAGTAGSPATGQIGSPFAADTTPGTPETTPGTPEATPSTPDGGGRGEGRDCPDKGDRGQDDAPAETPADEALAEAPSGSDVPAV